MTSEEFEKQLNELRTIINDGIAYFSAWRGLMVEDDESAHALDRYRGLFLPARNALLWMALMQFAKVFDHDSRTVSLRNLLTQALENREELTPNATSVEIEDIIEQVEANEALLERLKRLRDQRLAHHDHITRGDLSLPFGEVERVVEEIQAMYNSLRRGHDRVYTAFGNIAKDAARHTSQVVSIMREERNRTVTRSQ